VRYLIGLGNYTASDDAVGVRVVEHIVAHDLERGFHAIDLGAKSLDLVAYLVPGTTAIVLVDAADLGLAPGEYRFFTPASVVTQKALAGISTHEGDVLQVLELARQTGAPIPPLAILGIQPETLARGIGLSPDLEARLGEYSAAAVQKLAEIHGAG
jgi:hydrogenase maturation protease